MSSAFLRAYLDRIGQPESGPPTTDTLRRLHAAHVDAIPFENLDILLGRGIHLDLDHLREKLIARRRGGYCFEQNTLFLAALEAVGFTTAALEARVRTGASSLLPRTHMAIVVTIGAEQWLADVGFGGEGLREPVRLTGDETPFSAGLAHRVVREGDLLVLQGRHVLDAAWSDQYAFTLQPAHPVDFEVANWYTSTHPTSRFVRTLTAQRVTPDVRHVLRYPRLSEIDERGVRTREIGREELMPLLRGVFGVDLPDNTVFPAIDRAG